jgi:putative transposase
MKTVEQVREYGQQLNLPEPGRNALATAWSNPPARRVLNTWRSAVARFTSWKMSRTIQAESLWVEFLFIFLAEYAVEVLGYLDQPFKVKVPHMESSGKWSAHWYTPDFIVLYRDHVEVVECKTEDELQEISQKKPWLYVRRPDGSWSCPPAEESIKPYGFQFRVWTPPENCVVVVRNLRMLQDYLREDCPPVSDNIKTKLVSAVAENPGMTVADLMSMGDGCRADYIYTLVARGEIYFDLRKQILAEIDRAQLFINEATATAFVLIQKELATTPSVSLSEVRMTIGASLIWHARTFKIANFTEQQIILTSSDGSVELGRTDFEGRVKRGEITGLPDSFDTTALNSAREIVLHTSQDVLSDAVRKQWLLDHPESPESKEIPSRTKRHWRRLRRLGATTYNCTLIGLISNVRLRGNRKPKLPARIYELADKVIREHYMNAIQRSKTAAFGFLRTECNALGVDLPSFPWFCSRIGKVDRYELINSRSGRKAAYKYSEQIHGQANQNHGDRPWEVGLCDHTELDIRARCELTQLDLGRPWLSKLQCGYSRRVLAYVLTYDPPSYRTLMLLIRRCLQIHGRLPSRLVVDGAREFGSCYFETLMARCECTIIRRPPAQGRYGSLIERIFGTTTSQLIHNLSGNTKATKLVRQLTEEVDPKNHVVWTLPDLNNLLSTYYNEHYDCRPHPGLDMMTPVAKYAQGMDKTGMREHRIIPFTEDVYLLTLPPTRSGHARVQAGQGVTINRIRYWSDAMKDPEIEGQDVDVRFDPLDVSVAYVQIKGKWQKCLSEYSTIFQERTEREVEQASLIIRQRAKAAGDRLSVSAARLAEFLVSADAEEKLSKQRLQDAALKKILKGATQIAGTADNAVKLICPSQIQTSQPDATEVESTAAATELYPDC